MALPQLNQGTITPQQMQQYQAFTMKEAISTAMTAAKYQFTSNLISKSAILRNIPGSGILKERAELKKRELYEKQGRDESGRKLTQGEFEERQKRKQDAGKLKEIHDVLLEFLDNGIGTYSVKSPKDKMDSGKQLVVAPGAGGAYALEGEEQAQEREREDDRDQAESERREQGFFRSLFAGRNRDRDGSSGILGSLLGWLGSLGTSLFTGGLTGFLSTLFGPIMSVMGTLMTSVLGFVAPLMAAVGPILIAALPAIIALLLAGAAGTVIASWIDAKTEKLDKSAKRQGATGLKSEIAKTKEGEQLYTVKDSTGKTSVKTAKELGLTDQDIASGTDVETGVFTSASGSMIRAARYFTETEDGKATGRLAMGMNRPEMIEAARRAGAGGTSKLPSEIDSMVSKNIKDGKNLTPLLEDLSSLNMSMDEYTKTFESKIDDVAAPGIGQQLADGYNSVMDEAVRFQKKANSLGLGGEASDILKKLVTYYKPFERAENIGYGSFGKRASYSEQGLFSNASLNLPSDSDALRGGSDYYSATGNFKSIYEGRGQTKASMIENVTVPIAPMANENAALKQMPTPAPAVIDSSVNSTTNNTNATLLNPVSAQKTGADQTPKFNGSN